MFLKSSIIIASLIALIFAGCGADKRVVVAKDKTLPSWYKNPQRTTSSDLYALGEGQNRDEAIANALSQMASTLSVSVSSNYNAKTVVREGSINSSNGVYTNNVQSDVQKIRISNYELIQADSLGFKSYAVLIKSNKRQLFESLNKEINHNIAKVYQQELALDDANTMQKLAFYKKSTLSLKSLPNTIIVMNVLNPAFSGNEALHKQQEIEVLYAQTLDSISFSVESNRDANNLKSPISRGLSAKKLKIKRSNAKTHFNIYINSDIEEADSYGFTLARSEISIITKDYRGVVVGSNSLNIIGQSSQGMAIAKQNVAIKLNAMIKKEGIAKVLGLDI